MKIIDYTEIIDYAKMESLARVAYCINVMKGLDSVNTGLIIRTYEEMYSWCNNEGLLIQRIGMDHDRMIEAGIECAFDKLWSEIARRYDEKEVQDYLEESGKI